MKNRRLIAALMGVAALASLAGAAEARTVKKSAKPAAHARKPVAASRIAAKPPAGGLKPLSAADAKAYASAFAALRQGDFAAADLLAAGVSNPLLMGRLQFAKLMQPDYPARYDELAAWLKAYGDQPDAVRIYTLAKRRQPGGADDPVKPEAGEATGATWARVEAQAERIEVSAPGRTVDAKVQAAREAFYAGDIKKAQGLAAASGERWIGGLSAYRLKRYDEALERFAAVAQDPSQDEWSRSGAAYWAARAAIAAGRPQESPRWLNLAAATPYTFYGLIAERQLGLDPAVGADGMDMGVAAEPAAPAAAQGRVASPSTAGASFSGLIRQDVRARRAAALAQVGLKAEAGQQIREALLGSTAAGRRQWTGLALALGAPISSAADLVRKGRPDRFDIAQYPTPELAPEGGFTVDRALVYALVRQESRFRPDAASVSGAYGLMQLTPATAARIAGDDKLKRNPAPLMEPGLNLRLGQDYVEKLLGTVGGDLLHAVAAYNAGPGVIQKTLGQLGANGDSLLAIESMPGAQTREFVERVVAGYWIYRNIFGQTSQTLSAAAGGAKAVAAALDSGDD